MKNALLKKSLQEVDVLLGKVNHDDLEEKKLMSDGQKTTTML